MIKLLDFKCEDCSHIVEYLYKGPSDNLSKKTIQCPECKGIMRPDYMNKPTHGRHASWTNWNI